MILGGVTTCEGGSSGEGCGLSPVDEDTEVILLRSCAF